MNIKRNKLKFKSLSIKGQILTVSNHGFTLVELLVVIGVFAGFGALILSILFVTLRLSKKSEVILSLKQSGNSAASQVVKNIRYAKSLDSPTSCSPSVTTSSVTVTSTIDDSQTTFSCSVGGLSTVASNGASLIDTNAITVSDCSFKCTQADQNDPPIINLKFSLTNKAANNLVEGNGSVPFETSVIMRNITR